MTALPAMDRRQEQDGVRRVGAADQGECPLDRRRRQQQLPPQHLADAAGVRARRGALPLRRRWQPPDRLLSRHGPDDPRPQPAVVARGGPAIRSTGILFAGQGELEVEAARLVCEMVPCAERMRFGSSGSEVVQGAMRLARAATGRRTILKFEGHYHGWFDNILWSTAPGLNAAGPGGQPGPRRRQRRAGSAKRRTGSRFSPGTTSNVSRSGSPRATSRASSWKPPCAMPARSIPHRAISKARARPARARHGPDLRRGHHRLPPRARAARRSASASRPTSRPSARRSPTAFRSRRLRAGPTCSTCSRPAASCTAAPTTRNASPWRRRSRPCAT